MKTAGTWMLLASLAACGPVPRDGITPGGPEPVTATISDAEGEFGVRGGLTIEERAGGSMYVDLSFQAVVRAPDFAFFSTSIVELSDAAALLSGTPLQALAAQPSHAQASYQTRSGDAAARPVLDARLSRSADHTFELELDLGTPLPHSDAEPSALEPTAQARLTGRFVVGCSTIGAPFGEARDENGIVVGLQYHRVPDPTFQTPFCRQALVQLGLQEYLSP